MKCNEIVKEIIKHIYSGKLKENEQLPSITKGISIYTTSRNTVKKAYNTLENKGVIYKIQGKGHYICSFWDANIISSPSLSDQITETRSSEILNNNELVNYPKFLELAKNKKWKLFLKYYYNEEKLFKLNVVAINSSLIPFISKTIMEGSFISWLYNNNHEPSFEISETIVRDPFKEENDLISPKNALVVEENITTYDTQRKIICYAKWIHDPAFFKSKRYKGNY